MSIELKPFCHEAKIALSEDFELHMLLDFNAVDRLERLLNQSIHSVVGEMLKSVSTMTKVLWAITREHHGDRSPNPLSLNEVAGILLQGEDGDEETANAVAALLGRLFKKALNIAPMTEEKPVARKRKRG